MRKRFCLRIGVMVACSMAVSGCRERRGGDELPGPANPASWPGFAGSSAPVLVGHAVKPSELTESEMNYGIAPKRGSGVKYQDGIILMETGDQAIRSFSSNGMVWTFDANALQVSDFQVGKTIFATGRCVGKILVMQRDGDKVSVILGPAQLTDVVKEGNFAYDQPLDLNSLVAIVTPDYPGAADPASYPQAGQASRTSSHRARTAVQRSVSYYVVSPEGRWTPMRTVSRGPEASEVRADFHPSARCGSGFATLQAPTAPTVPGGLPSGAPGLSNFPPAPMPTAQMPNFSFDLYTSMTALNESRPKWVPCAQGTFNMQLGAGIGYSMPTVVASVVNAFLSLYHAPPVRPLGSIANLPHRAALFDHVDQKPNGCGGKGSP